MIKVGTMNEVNGDNIAEFFLTLERSIQNGAVYEVIQIGEHGSGKWFQIKGGKVNQVVGVRIGSFDEVTMNKLVKHTAQ